MNASLTESGVAIVDRAPLAPLTTLELGGPAQHFVRASDRASLIDALRWANARGLPVTVLGGGSNVVVSDAGIAGLVVRVDSRGVNVTQTGDAVQVTVEAGESWDRLVERSVNEGWAGLECLSGIPGLVGATPIQNVGAYGQEVAECIRSVELLDRTTLEVCTWSDAECGFGYRTSKLKTVEDRHVVLAVTFALRAGGAPALRYPELIKALGERQAAAVPPSLADVRERVLALRRAKSMLIDAGDPNRRSAGSFFLNPVLSLAHHQALCERALAAGVVARSEDVPGFAAADGCIKVPAAWLIERAGISRGTRTGAVGVSSRHALALVHHGGGTSAELIQLAASIQARVEQMFGVVLKPEPVFLGFGAPPLAAGSCSSPEESVFATTG